MFARTTTAALAFAAVASLGLTACDSDQGNPPAGQPTASQTTSPAATQASTPPASIPPATQSSAPSPSASREPATPVTEANLPSADQITYLEAKFTQSGGGEGEGQAPIARCQPAAWSSFGANATFSRAFASGADNSEGGRAHVTIASFASHEAALAAAQKMTAKFASCGSDAAALHVAKATAKQRTVTLPSGQTAHLLGIDMEHENGELANEQTGVVVTGTHAQLVVIEQPGAAPTPASTDEMLKTLTKTVQTLA